MDEDELAIPKTIDATKIYKFQRDLVLSLFTILPSLFSQSSFHTISFPTCNSTARDYLAEFRAFVIAESSSRVRYRSNETRREHDRVRRGARTKTDQR